MKKSIDFLPEDKQKDLSVITGLVRESLSDDCAMIILYGSYATGKYVEYDQREEYGIRTYFMSDYDLLVVTTNRKNPEAVSRKLSKVTDV